MNSIFVTASTLKAILCFIDAEKTPKIAFDTDDATIINALINRIKVSVDEKDGSQDCVIKFGKTSDELELERQFSGIAGNIKNIFDKVQYCIKSN